MSKINLLPLNLQPFILHDHEGHDLQANPDVNPTANIPAESIEQESGEISVSGGGSDDFSGHGTVPEDDPSGSQSLVPSPAPSSSGSRTGPASGSRWIPASGVRVPGIAAPYHVAMDDSPSMSLHQHPASSPGLSAFDATSKEQAT